MWTRPACEASGLPLCAVSSGSLPRASETGLLLQEGVGQQNREESVRLGLAQVEVAQISGGNQAELSCSERGFANPTLAILAKLADALQCERRIVVMERETRLPGATWGR